MTLSENDLMPLFIAFQENWNWLVEMSNNNYRFALPVEHGELVKSTKRTYFHIYMKIWKENENSTGMAKTSRNLKTKRVGKIQTQKLTSDRNKVMEAFQIRLNVA